LFAVRAAEFFTFPWPGPGNSEGPVNPDEWVEVEAKETPEKLDFDGSTTALLATTPWPGPGDSEG
jgi:hypothetical protein